MPLEFVSPLAWQQVNQWMTQLRTDLEVFVSPQGSVPRVFQQTLILPDTLVRRIESIKEETDKVQILHELGHVLARDSHLLSWAMQISRLALAFGVLALLFGISLGATIVVLNQFHEPTDLFYLDFPSMYLWALRPCWLAAAALSLYAALVATATRSIQRSSEFLADAYVVEILGKIGPLQRALWKTDISRSLGRLEGLSEVPDNEHSLAFDSNTLKQDHRAGWLKKSIQHTEARLLPTHPTRLQRLAALHTPWYALNISNMSTAIGLIAVLFFVQAPYDVELIWRVAAILIVGYTGLANYAAAHALQADNDLRRMIKSVLISVTRMFVGFMLGLLVVGASLCLLTALEWGLGQVAGIEPADPLVRVEQIPSILLGVLHALGLAFPLLALLLVGNAIVSREQLTWYRLFTEYPFPTRLLSISGLVAIYPVLAGVVGYYALWPLGRLLLCAWQPILVCLTWPLIAFILYASHYRKKCPDCNETVPGFFRIGKECPGCGYRLNQWLLSTPTQTNEQ
jgi:hypothetical protein